MSQAWPDAPPEGSLPSSAILGVIRISEQRPPEDCGGPQGVWAVGPICHVISEAIQLPQPILAVRGSPGLWRLTAKDRVEVVRQLPKGQHIDLPVVPKDQRQRQKDVGRCWCGGLLL